MFNLVIERKSYSHTNKPLGYGSIVQVFSRYEWQALNLSLGKYGTVKIFLHLCEKK